MHLNERNPPIGQGESSKEPARDMFLAIICDIWKVE